MEVRQLKLQGRVNCSASEGTVALVPRWQCSLALPCRPARPCAISGCVHKNTWWFRELTKNTLIKKKQIKITNPECFQSSRTIPEWRSCPVPEQAAASEAGLILPWEMLYDSILHPFNSSLFLNTQRTHTAEQCRDCRICLH